MIKIRDEELLELADAIDVPIDVLMKLTAMSLLKESAAIDTIIRFEYKKIMQKKSYKPSQVMLALADKYKVNVTRVRSAVWGKYKTIRYCSQCGNRISGNEWSRNQGLCNECMTDKIRKEVSL